MQRMSTEECQLALGAARDEYNHLSGLLQTWQQENPHGVIAKSVYACELILQMAVQAEKVLCLEGKTYKQIKEFLEILLAQLDDPPKPPGLPARPTLSQGGPFLITLNTSSLLVFRANRICHHTSHTPCDTQDLS